MRATEEITFTQLIQPIAMSPNFIHAGIDTVVSGWGPKYPDTEVDSQFLQFAAVRTVECPDQFPFSLQYICAGTADPLSEVLPTRPGICKTDIGGPVVLRNQLIGIAAYHDPLQCGSAAIPVSFIDFFLV